jgi:hypothetical protein
MRVVGLSGTSIIFVRLSWLVSVPESFAEQSRFD